MFTRFLSVMRCNDVIKAGIWEMSAKSILMAIPYVAVLVGLYGFQSAWVSLGLYHFTILLVMLAAGRRGLIKSIWSGFNGPAAIVLMPLFALAAPLIILLWPYMSLGHSSLQTILTGFGLEGISWYLFMASFVTAQPILEELYWRGYQRNDSRKLCLSDIAFAGYHALVLVRLIRWPWVVAALVVIVAAGYLWRQINNRFGGLAVCILSHICADAAFVVAAHILISRS
jgi:membrane protease YdiL (CAAX protease family)